MAAPTPLRPRPSWSDALAYYADGSAGGLPQTAAAPDQWGPETISQIIAAAFAPLRYAALASSDRHRPGAVAGLVTILSLAPSTSSRRRPLTATEIAALDRVLGWLEWLEPADATIVAGVALGMSPGRLGRMVSLTPAHCKQRHAALLDALTYALNKHGERPAPLETG